MIKQALKRKPLILALVLAGALVLSTSHSMAMSMQMNDTVCFTKVLCGACAVPIPSESPKLIVSDFFQQSVSEPALRVLFPHSEPLYHPPR